MAYADDLQTIRDNLATELKNESDRRRELTAAGVPPPTTYTLNTGEGKGRTYDWNGYLAAMLDTLAKLDTRIAEALLVDDETGGLFEIHTRGW